VEASEEIPRGDPEGYALAFNEGVRALSEQQAVIDSFRTRSGLEILAWVVGLIDRA
jgi:hypothetical protein